MKLSAKKGNLIDQPVDLLVVNLFQGVKKPGGATGAVDQSLEGLITELIKEENFQGKLSQTLLLRPQGKIPAKKVVLVGLGKKEKFSPESIRRVSATIIKLAKNTHSRTIASILHGAGEGNLDPHDAANALATGSLLADYSFTKYQKQKAKQEKTQAISSLTVIDRNNRKVSAASKAISQAVKIYPGIKLARDLVNEPGLEATPTRLVEETKRIASSSPQISLTVHDEKQLKKMGAGALLSVARGSEEPAYLIHLKYQPKTANKKIALLGKGVTFDTGGYSLKPSRFMNTMKLDMGGAATVIGVFKVIAELNPSVEVHGIIPTTENLISGRAIKPGDVVTAMNKKTIEVINTDAEGRMILADALSYIADQKWDSIIDFATLTGACMVALGDQIAGLFSNNDALADQIKTAADLEGEPVWRLPLVEDYQKLIKSNLADVQNIGKSKYAGAITAALFLQEFVPAKTPWAHLDIAGPAYGEKATLPYLPQGGTGFAIRTITRLLLNLK